MISLNRDPVHMLIIAVLMGTIKNYKESFAARASAAEALSLQKAESTTSLAIIILKCLNQSWSELTKNEEHH